MRRFTFALALLIFGLPHAALASQAPTVIITAQRIALHSDRSLLIADSGVSVHIGTAIQIGATRAAYDLRSNRLTAVGDVKVAGGAAVPPGSGYVFDFSTNKGGADANASIPQLAASDALATGQQVELRPGETIVFSNAQVLAGPTFVPAASYVYAIPAANAKDFGYSPVPSAALEWPFIIAETRNAYAFARTRYDRYTGGAGMGLEEHYARTNRGYLAAGETLDRDAARYDLASYERLSDSLSQSFTGSYLAGTHTARYALTSSGKRGYASFSIWQYNAARSDDVLIVGNQRSISHVGSVRLQADFGHDVHPGDWRVAQDLRFTPGIHIDTAALHVGPSSFTGSLDVGEAFYNYGRATLSSTASLWGNVPATRRLQLSGGVSFSHNAPPFPATYRSYTLGATWKASDAFNIVTSLGYAHDYGQEFDVGRPQFTAALDVRFRRRNHTGFEVGAIAPFGGVGNMNRQAGLNVRFFKW